MGIRPWHRLLLFVALLVGGVTHQAEAQVRIVWDGGDLNAITSDEMAEYCTDARAMSQRFRIYYDGATGGSRLSDALGGSLALRQYVIRVDGRQAPCQGSSAHPQNGNCFWDAAPSETDEGYRIKVADALFYREHAAWAFQAGTHTLSIELVGASASASMQYTIDCGGGAPPPAAPPPAALGDPNIAWERNAVTGKAFQGVVADGVSTVRLRFRLPGATSARVEASLGSFTDDDGNALRGGALPLQNGEAIIRFVPPDYLTRGQMTGTLTLDRAITGISPEIETDPWVAPVEIIFTYAGAGGATGEESKQFKLLRPPVIYIHGFQGQASTWPDVMNYMRGQHFAGRADAYYARNASGEQDVRAQAGLLHEIVQDEIQDYAESGIRLTRVDLVAHSMGGLIARQYVRGFRDYAGGVRKVITVATPHHGIIRGYRNMGGAAYAWWTALHRAMKEDVHFQSPFMAALNAGEGAGGHLNPAVQYGNMFVMPDDGVVFAGSADLEAVEERLFLEDLSHTTAVPAALGDILAWPAAKGQISQWLLRDLVRTRLSTLRVEVATGTGQVTVGHLDPYGTSMDEITETVRSFPHPLEEGYSVHVGGGRATVHWVLNNQVLATLALDANSEVRTGPWVPNDVGVVMVEGKGLFQTFKSPGVPDPSFDVTLAAGLYGPREYDLVTPARVRSFGTTFAVSADDGLFEIHVLDGRVRAEDERTAGSGAVDLGPGNSVRLAVGSPPQTIQAPASPWWEAILTPTARPGQPPTVQPGRRPAQPPAQGGGGGEFSLADVYGLESYAIDAGPIQAGINGRIERGFAPVGLSVKGGQVHVLYLGGEVLSVSEWQLDPYASADALSAGMTDRMNQGLLPTGLSWDDGTFYVLYLRTELTGTAWQIVTSAIDLESAQRDIQPYLDQGYTPFDVGLTDTQYMTLLVQLGEPLAKGWSIEGGSPNQLRELIEGQLLDGLFPWGLIHGEVANVLFLRF